VAATHIALQLVDRHPLPAAHDVERDRLVGVTAQAFDLKVEIAGIDRIASVGEGWAGPWKAIMRLFHASQASRSAFRRATAARSSDARTEAP
jgi:hypothetical protein